MAETATVTVRAWTVSPDTGTKYFQASVAVPGSAVTERWAALSTTGEIRWTPAEPRLDLDAEPLRLALYAVSESFTFQVLADDGRLVAAFATAPSVFNVPIAERR